MKSAYGRCCCHINNGYIINTDTGSYYFEADAEIDDSVPPTDDNNGSTGGNNNQTTTDGNKGNNEGTKLSSDKIQEAVAAITTAKAGDTYTVDMSDATVAPKDVLEAAKGKDVDIVLDMNGYKWTINGNNIQADNLKDINLAVDTDSDAIPDDVISELAGNNPVKQISLAYSGDFGLCQSGQYQFLCIVDESWFFGLRQTKYAFPLHSFAFVPLFVSF